MLTFSFLVPRQFGELSACVIARAARDSGVGRDAATRCDTRLMLLAARSSSNGGLALLRARVQAPALHTSAARLIHPELRPSDVTSIAMKRKLVAKQRASRGADALATAAEGEREPAPAGPAPGIGAWLGANMAAGFAMALGFSAVAVLFRVVFGADAGGDTARREAWLDRAGEAAAAAAATQASTQLSPAREETETS